MLSPLLLGVLASAIVFEFINGFHDTANTIATTVYTRALPVRTAILMSAGMNFIGALTSEKVAMTIAHGLVNVPLELYVILAALLGAIIWDLATWWFSIPSSSSHALIGSLIGATMMFTMSLGTVEWSGVCEKVVIPLFTSPLIGFCIGFLLMKVLLEVFAYWHPARASKLFHKLQIASSLVMSYSHGNNDAQKTMGIITLALIASGVLPQGSGVPMWVKITCAATMALGTSIGGRRIMKTVGNGVTKLDSALGFAAQVSSAVAIETMTALGAPVSTIQVLTTSIMGAGSVRGAKKVKWGMAGSIFTAWVVTLPATIALGGLCAFIIGLVM
jgi:PiT family inorganic phosphate transporter